MIDYQNGKIYAIKSFLRDEVYIGSTCQKYLSDRLKGHRQKYRYWQKHNSNYITSFIVLKNVDHYIELIENCPCNNVEELKKRERYWIQSGKYNVVNKVVPTRTHREYTEENKKKKTICDCGSIIALKGLSTHKSTKKHQKFIKKSQEIEN